MLLALNDLSPNPLNANGLSEIALQLGSDVPFFLEDGPSLAEGQGERLQPMPALPQLAGAHFALVNPGIHINTGEAYAGTTLSGERAAFTAIQDLPLERWKEVLFNSMESHAFRAHPVIADIKRSLYAAGASFALMSGSGSTVYGIFSGEVPEMTWPDGWFSYSSGS